MRIAASPILLVFALLVCFGVNAISGKMNAYYVDVALNVGIAVVMAISLNLINGYTGQFSLGHAGFMAVGAYGAATISITAPKSPPITENVSATPSTERDRPRWVSAYASSV